MSVIHRIARNARFFTLAVLVVAIGVATHLAAMALAEAVVFPQRDPAAQQLVRVFASYPGESGMQQGSAPWTEVLKESAHAFAAVAAYSDEGIAHAIFPDTDPLRIRVGVADPQFFDVVGKPPAIGRVFGGADEPGVLLTHRYWRSAFDADPDVLGRTLRIDRRTYPIVGVLPQGFESPEAGRQVDVWASIDLAPTLFTGVIPVDFRERSGFGWLNVVARLRDGMRIDDAARVLDARLGPQAADPAFGPSPEGAKRLTAAALRDYAEAAVDPNGTSNHRRNAWLVTLLATLALCVSCVNIGGLLSLRGEARQQEIGVRLGIGATPSQIMRVLFDETLVVGIAGFVLGWLAALFGLEQILRDPPTWLAVGRFDALSVLLRPELLATTALIYAAVLLAAVSLPLKRAARTSVMDAMRAGGASPAKGRQLLRSALVCGQFAITVALLVAGSMLLRSYINQSSVDLGFDAAGVAVIPVSVAGEGRTFEDYEPMLRRLQDEAAGFGAVEASAWIMSVPVQGGGMRTTVVPVFGDPASGEPTIEANVVSPGAFDVLGVRLIEGREFRDSDTADARAVVVVNQAFVDTYLRGRAAVGNRVGGLADDRGGAEIVGVVGNHKKRSVKEGDVPQIYLPLAQFPMQTMSLLVKSRGGEESIAATVPALLRKRNPDVRIGTARTLQEHVASSMRESRSLLAILLSVACLASLLAAIGMFAVVDQWFHQRRRELSIRIAVGATFNALRVLIVRQAAGIVAAALVIGTLLTLASAQAFADLLFEVSRFDPASYAIAWTLTGLLTAASLLATLSAAAKLSPAEMLKSE